MNAGPPLPHSSSSSSCGTPPRRPPPPSSPPPPRPLPRPPRPLARRTRGTAPCGAPPCPGAPAPRPGGRATRRQLQNEKQKEGYTHAQTVLDGVAEGDALHIRGELKLGAELWHLGGSEGGYTHCLRGSGLDGGGVGVARSLGVDECLVFVGQEPGHLSPQGQRIHTTGHGPPGNSPEHKRPFAPHSIHTWSSSGSRRSRGQGLSPCGARSACRARGTPQSGRQEEGAPASLWISCYKIRQRLG